MKLTKKFVANTVIAIASIAVSIGALVSIIWMGFEWFFHSHGPNFDPKYGLIIFVALVPMGIIALIWEKVMPTVWCNLKKICKIWKSR